MPHDPAYLLAEKKIEKAGATRNMLIHITTKGGNYGAR